MKKHFSILLFFIAILSIVTSRLTAQTDTTETEETPDEVIINGKRYKAVDDKTHQPSKPKRKSKPLDSTFVMENKKFQYYNNWMSFGGGVQQNITYKRELGFVAAVDVNFHIKRNYLQAGALISGERFAHYNNYQLHFGYVRRFEDNDLHYSAAIGPTYSWGFQVVPIDPVKNTIRSYNEPGFYIQGEVIKKISYDVGMGACLFTDVNKEQSMIGLRFTLYFSGAYTGKRNKSYEDY
ncbi:MAG: hypothetical protein V4608_06610 [Bacteroidota bacterium]